MIEKYLCLGCGDMLKGRPVALPEEVCLFHLMVWEEIRLLGDTENSIEGKGLEVLLSKKLFSL